MCHESPSHKLTRKAASRSDAAVVLTFDGAEVTFQSSIIASSARSRCWSDLRCCLQERVNSRRVMDILRKVCHQRLQRLRVLRCPEFLKRIRGSDCSGDVTIQHHKISSGRFSDITAGWYVFRRSMEGLHTGPALQPRHRSHPTRQSLARPNWWVRPCCTDFNESTYAQQGRSGGRAAGNRELGRRIAARLGGYLSDSICRVRRALTESLHIVSRSRAAVVSTSQASIALA